MGELLCDANRRDNEAHPDELGYGSGAGWAGKPGQAGDPQQLSEVAETEENVGELADTDQALEAAAVEGSEDAADHPDRPVHPHTEYRRQKTCLHKESPEKTLHRLARRKRFSDLRLQAPGR